MGSDRVTILDNAMIAFAGVIPDLEPLINEAAMLRYPLRQVLMIVERSLKRRRLADILRDTL